MFGSTIGQQDLYGGSDPLAGTSYGGGFDPAGGTVQAVAGAKSMAQPGDTGGSASAPAFSWVAMIALLVGIRVLYEYAS